MAKDTRYDYGQCLGYRPIGQLGSTIANEGRAFAVFGSLGTAQWFLPAQRWMVAAPEVK